VAFADDLLQQAFELANKNAEDPTQADLRRSVSSAYYALFHLLTSKTITHWSLESSRGALGRMFEHSLMNRALDRIADAKLSAFREEDTAVVEKLRMAAQSFVQLQHMRKTADYDATKIWRHNKALLEIETASNAFALWQAIKHEKIAQEYLVSLSIKPRD